MDSHARLSPTLMGLPQRERKSSEVSKLPGRAQADPWGGVCGKWPRCSRSVSQSQPSQNHVPIMSKETLICIPCTASSNCSLAIGLSSTKAEQCDFTPCLDAVQLGGPNGTVRSTVFELVVVLQEPEHNETGLVRQNILVDSQAGGRHEQRCPQLTFGYIGTGPASGTPSLPIRPCPCRRNIGGDTTIEDGSECRGKDSCE